MRSSADLQLYDTELQIDDVPLYLFRPYRLSGLCEFFNFLNF